MDMAKVIYMDMRSLFSALSLVAVIIYIYIGSYTYRQNKKSVIHRTFLLLCVSYAIWSFAYAFAYVSTNGYIFSFWNKVAALGWCSFSAITLYLVLQITENKPIKNRIIKSITFFPALLFYFMAVFLFGEGIKTPPVISKIFYTGNFLYNFTYLLASIIILFIWGARSNSIRVKKQSRILVIAGIIPFVLDLLTDTILPLLGVEHVPLVGQLYSVIMIMGSYVVIEKYKFLRLPEKFIYEEVSKQILDMFIITNEKGRILRISQYTLNMLGYKESELLKLNIEDIIQGRAGERFSLELIKQKDYKYSDITLFKKDGQSIPVNVSSKRILDSRLHDLLGVILVIQDISLFYELQQKNEELNACLQQITATEEELRYRYDLNLENEKKLSISEEKFRMVFEQAPLGIVLQDSLTGRLLEINSKFNEITGRSTEELINSGLLGITHIEDIRESAEKISLLRSGTKKSYSINKRYTKPDGSVVWVNAKVVSVSSEGMHPCEICMVEDITEQKQSQETLTGIIENNPMSIQVIDRNGYTKKVNEAYISLFGFVPDSQYCWFEDKQFEQLGLGELVVRAKNGEVIYFPDFYYKVHDYVLINIRMMIFPILKNEFISEQYVIMYEDVSERKRMEKLIYSENERFKTTLLSVADGVISTDRYGNIELINKVGESLTGWTQEEALGKPLEKVFNIVNEFTEEQCENPVLKVLQTGKTIEIDNSTILISRDGTKRLIEDSAAPIMDQKGTVTGVVLVFRDFTERKEKQKQIEYLSYHDQLTGLYNRRFFEEELKRLDVERNLPLAIVMADVNGLKLINDSFGHTLGDELIKKVAEVIKNGCRADDIVARLGGDEFVIILPKTDNDEVASIIKRIKELALNEKVRSIDISVSFGYEVKEHRDEKVVETLKKAEDHMYKKKLFESPSMRGKTVQAIISTLHEKNKREEQHSRRVSELCLSMGEALGLPEGEFEELKTVGLLHDIGKIAIEESILNKPGELEDNERQEIMRHPEIGYRILSTVNDMSEMANYVLAHHERWDGKGYPKNLEGKEIPLQSRIIAIIDAYDAMTSERSYRNALSEEYALSELQKNAGTQFDPELVSVFIEKVLGKSSAKVSD
jgi:diguanylate cyclase (GGDEF)-like protein/PAS domain S-box-containing protein